MERERPEYLDGLKDHASRFPWLAVIGLALLAAMIGGALIYLRTVEAWEANRRPQWTKQVDQQPSRGDPRWEAMTPAQRAQRAAEDEALIREFRLQANERLKREIEDRKRWKCVNGTPFRPIPGGGWENVPGQRC